VLLIRSISVITYLAYRVLEKSCVVQYVKSFKYRYQYGIYLMERRLDDDTVQTPSAAEIQTSSTVTKTLKARARITALFRINSDVYKHILCCTCHPSKNTGRVLRMKNSGKKLRAKNSALFRHISRWIGITRNLDLLRNKR